MEFSTMAQPTQHTGFNKLILVHPIQKGTHNTPVQFSLLLPSVDTLKHNGERYERGSLFQSGFDIFEQFVKQRGKSAYFTYGFTKMVRELALNEDVIVYCFMLPDAKTHLSYAVAAKDGCRYIETTGKNDKQVSINTYIINKLNTDGWF